MLISRQTSMVESSNPSEKWRQVGGYFDGDGTVIVDIQMFTLGACLSFADNWLPQLEMIRIFLTEEGIKAYIPNKKMHGAYELRIVSVASIIEAAKKMSPYVLKKQAELQMLIAYYANEVTGEQVIESLNQEVIAGKRIGKIRTAIMPYTYSQGRKMAYDLTNRQLIPAIKIAVPEETKKSIVADRLSRGISEEKIATLYGFSRSVIRRVLREGVS